jgi:ACR3 family arsenite transporter
VGQEPLISLNAKKDEASVISSNRFGRFAKNITGHLGLYACGTVVLGIAIGSVWKPPWLRYVIPLAVFLVLYPFMFDLELERIKNALARPTPLAGALFLNLVVSPLLAFALSSTFFSNQFPWLTVGLVLFGCVPCGGMVPAYTGILKGNVNLSVTITALSLLLSIIAVPFWTKVLLGALVPVPALLIAQYLVVIIAAPFLSADLTRRFLMKTKGPSALESFKKEIKSLSGPGLMLFIFIIFVLNGDSVRGDPALILKVALPVSLFLVLLLVIGRLLAKLARTTPEDATAVQIGSTVKNTAIAIALAIASFDARVALVLAISGPLAQLPTMLIFLRWKKTHY